MENAKLFTSDFASLAQLIDDRVEETTSLEFKRKPNPNQVELQKQDKKMIGEAVSGFANATGGLLIVGIGTTEENGIDRAATLEMIENAEAVAARCQAYLSECVSPPVEGAEVRAVLSDGGRGLVLIRVPQGQRRPHMSRPHHSYYRRVADRFVPMEAYEVEEMMRLKTSPSLELIWESRSAGSTGGSRIVDLLFGLHNPSRVTAKFGYVEYEHQPGGPRIAEYGLDGNGRNLWANAGVAMAHPVFAAGADQVIHPDQAFYVSKLQICERPLMHDPKKWPVSEMTDDGMLELTFRFGCEGMPQATDVLRFTKPELLTLFR